MRLVLTLTEGGSSVPNADRGRTLSSSGSAASLSIGRGPDNDWVLPDPQKKLSRTHCSIAFGDGRFVLTDRSSNGLYINQSQQPTERDSKIVLSQGDEFKLGGYVISVSMVDDKPGLDLGSMDLGGARPGADDDPRFRIGTARNGPGPLDVDPLADVPRPSIHASAPAPPIVSNRRGPDPFEPPRPTALSAFDTDDEDLLGGLRRGPDWRGLPAADHAPATSQAIGPARVVSSRKVDFDALIGDLDMPGDTPVAPPSPPEMPRVEQPPQPRPVVRMRTAVPPDELTHNPVPDRVAEPPPTPRARDVSFLDEPITPAGHGGGAVPPPAVSFEDDELLPQHEPRRPAPVRAAPPPAAFEEEAELPGALPDEAPRPPANARVAGPAADSFDEEGDGPPAAFEPAAAPPDPRARQPAPERVAAPRPVANRQDVSPPEEPAAGPSGDAAARAALAAFLEGAGMPRDQFGESDPEALLLAAGKVFRAMTEGFQQVLKSRAAVKSDMGIEQTIISGSGNNPLKFSVTSDDAVRLMLGPRTPGYMEPVAAARQASRDIEAHELAVMAGVQHALLSLLRRFDPEELEKRMTAGVLGGLLPGARKARYWDAFKLSHGDLSREAEDEFQTVFGRPFAKAYNEQTRKD